MALPPTKKTPKKNKKTNPKTKQLPHEKATVYKSQHMKTRMSNKNTQTTGGTYRLWWGEANFSVLNNSVTWYNDKKSQQKNKL